MYRKISTLMMMSTAFVGLSIFSLSHAEDKIFDGYTLKIKLIGGAQYENLYTIIPDWEKKTGAKVEILSRKNHFELDREIKQDIAAGSLGWCVGSIHTNFTPQYPIFIDLKPYIPQEIIDAFVPLVIEHSTIDGKLLQLPRHSDVSNMYYLKSVFEDENNKNKFKEEYGYDLAPPETWDNVRDQAIFFADPPNFYGTHYVGKDEAIVGRFYELLVAEGGEFLDKDFRPAFNSEAGIRALNWFVDLYKAKAVPAGVPNYLWDDVGLGFAAGNIALDLDWAGWAGYFNNAEAGSKIAGNVGIIRAPKGSSGKRTGWSGSHTFGVTNTCDNIEAAVSFITFLTGEEAQMIEARAGLLPTRTAVWDKVTDEFKANNDDFMVEVFETFKTSMAEDAFTPPLIPEWTELSNALWPQLQSAILGEKTAQEALDKAAKEMNIIMEDAGYY